MNELQQNLVVSSVASDQFQFYHDNFHVFTEIFAFVNLFHVRFSLLNDVKMAFRNINQTFRAELGSERADILFAELNQSVNQLFWMPSDWNNFLEQFPNHIRQTFEIARWHMCRSCKEDIATAGNAIDINLEQLVTLWLQVIDLMCNKSELNQRFN